jgi:hypothetical protein
MQLPDIIKAAGVGDKIKEGMEKGQKAGEERRKTWDRDKRKGWFSRWRYGRSRCAALLEIYKEQKQLEER